MKRNDETCETADGSARTHGRRRGLTRRCRRPGALAVLGAVAALALAACSGASAGSPQVARLGSGSGSGGSGGSGGGASRPTGNPTKLLDEWAACIRKHGDPNQVDPTIDSNKDIEITMTNVPEALKRAVHGSTGPCSNYLLAAENDLRGGQPAPTDNPAQDVKFADCMRASGFPNWPDSVNGQTNFLTAGIDPNSQAAQKASKACDGKLGIRYYAPGTEMPGVVIVGGAGGCGSAGQPPVGGTGVPVTGASRAPGGSGVQSGGTCKVAGPGGNG